MSNKAVPRRFMELFALEHDVEACESLLDPAAVIHMSVVPTPLDVDGYKQVGYDFLTAFPDLTGEILQQVEEGDTVVTHARWSGTHTGPLMGIPATGRSFTSTGVLVDRVQNGRIVERWEVADMFTVFQHLGLIPAPEAA